ncbi:hypothetical protein AALB_2181 [Agarivorans albus MKT 106]|uniref:Uncharacterized protein n=1 Tax=Agarivorans albus MKT 106 TaxID=1331007 RepID=R9PTA9_AGAAL|nr:hypothetical protein AALB_2181 [Agarivorans albus MKT 106]
MVLAKAFELNVKKSKTDSVTSVKTLFLCLTIIFEHLLYANS